MKNRTIRKELSKIIDNSLMKITNLFDNFKVIKLNIIFTTINEKKKLCYLLSDICTLEDWLVLIFLY